VVEGVQGGLALGDPVGAVLEVDAVEHLGDHDGRVQAGVDAQQH